MRSNQILPNKFKTVLEQQHAVFFEALGIKWHYTPKEFNLEGYQVIPNFYLGIKWHYTSKEFNLKGYQVIPNFYLENVYVGKMSRPKNMLKQNVWFILKPESMTYDMCGYIAHLLAKQTGEYVYVNFSGLNVINWFKTDEDVSIFEYAPDGEFEANIGFQTDGKDVSLEFRSDRFKWGYNQLVCDAGFLAENLMWGEAYEQNKIVNKI